jgi:hypothetical protein
MPIAANIGGERGPSFRPERVAIIAAAWTSLERINAVKALRLLLCFAVAACADLETKNWYRVDGNLASPERLDLDKTACRQEMQRSVQATTQAAGLDRNIVRSDVYGNCMARLGYSDTNNQRFTAPVAAQGSAPLPPVQSGTAPAAVQGGTTMPVQGGTVPPPVQGSPPAPTDQQCRKTTDFRMWLPLCP